MGICGSSEERDAKATSDKISKDLKKQKKSFQNELRLLLLGAGESGKSTIVKQMRIIYSDGFSEKEKNNLVKSVHGNVLASLKALVDGMEHLNISLGDASLSTETALIQELADAESFSSSDAMWDAAKKLWKDSGVQAAFSRSNEFQCPDSTKYFLSDVDRLRAADYLPTEQDVLRLRIQTTGIFETKFIVDDITFHMFDVGGQRSERRKWIQCFGDVTGIIFLVATSAYDQVLLEDSTQNRLKEALELFGSIWKNKWLESVSIILFLNKVDILEQKIVDHPLEGTFPEYSGGADFEKAKEFIQKMFLDIGQPTEKKQVFPHFTIGVDTENVWKVFYDVKEIIRDWNLREYGLM